MEERAPGIYEVKLYSTEPVWMKFVFSCLEYLYDEDFALRENRNGILYWETP